MSALMIAGTQVQQDKTGRYSLNDLHVASGGESRHQPAFFMKRPETVELVAEISYSAVEQNCAPVASKAGRYGGTYVCKELVYAYAMWVSPKFHLHVIRTFDAMVAGKPANDVPPPARQLSVASREFGAALRLAKLAGLEGNQARLSANRMVKQAIGVDVMELAGAPRLVNETQELNYTATELGAKFGMSAKEMNKLLEKCGLQRHAESGNGRKRWELLPDGKVFAVITDTGKRHSDGQPVQQVLWKESVLGMLKRLAEQLKSSRPTVITGGLQA